jgi:hypothetical protein
MYKTTMLLLKTLLVATGVSAANASPWPLRTRDKVPASFDCLMRQAAYAYGQRLIPRHGIFPDLFWALDLTHCNATLGTIDIYSTASRRLYDTSTSSAEDRKGKTTIPEDAVFVAVNGNDLAADGSEQSPFQSLQAAVDFAVKYTNSKSVIVRGGVHYLSETLQLTPQHSGLQILAYPSESPVFSGGQPLFITKWEPYKTHAHNVLLKHKNKYKDKAEPNIWVTNLGAQLKGGMPGLQINGVRSTVARYPNLEGGIEVSCGYGCMVDSNQAEWTKPSSSGHQKIQYYTDRNETRSRPNAGWFEHYQIGVHGACDVYDPPVSYWCGEHPSGGGAQPFVTPSGMIPKEKALPNSPYQHMEDARVFVWRPERWANWMFHVAEYDPKINNITFGVGGNQGARGNENGGDWFVENLLEELDHPNEFYYDKRTQNLYLWYNGTGAPPLDASFVVPQLRTLVNATGTQWNPVKNVTLAGITCRATRFTYMDPHGVPSAGDWALERNGAIFLQGTREVAFHNCTFERLDGNAVMISGYNRNTTISESDFSFIGGTAIASWGYTNETEADPGRPGVHLEGAPASGVDGTDGEHPRYNVVKGCTIREVGLYEKQASFYMQAKTAYTTLTGNVFFNGPRAGVNFNDGFGGGDEISHSLVFSTCRDSGDRKYMPWLILVAAVG